MEQINISKVCDELRDQGVELVRFLMPDLLGRQRGKSVGIDCAEDAMRNGVGIFSGTVAMGYHYEIPHLPRCVDQGCPTACMKPANDSMPVIPWSKGKVAEVVCDLYWPDGSEVVEAPRGILRRQLERLHSKGYHLLSGFECEFILYKKDTMQPVTEFPEYCNIATRFEDFTCELARNLRQVGINIETSGMEYSPGQMEFAFKPLWDMTSVEDLLRYKDAVRAVCAKYDFVPSFMTRAVDVNGASNGLHFNHSLWDADKKTNLFHSPVSDYPGGLSDIGRYWLGGIMKHLDAITMLCSPTVNCYRRLHAPWAPDNKDWGVDHRFTTIRVVGERGCRIENRIVSGSANPYLAVAVTIAAGLDGIENEIEPPPEGRNESAAYLPHTLQEAMDAFKKDQAMVSALGKEFLEWWEQLKDYELKAFKDHDVKSSKSDELEKERDFYFMV